MDDIESRLKRCFGLIFPALDEKKISSATMASVRGWDSIATVNLVNIVEEEFQIQIGLDDVEQVVSFTALLNYLQSRADNGRH